MAAGDPLASISEICTLRTDGSSEAPFWKYVDGRVGAVAAVAGIAGRETTLWAFNGAPMSGGAWPTSVAAPTNATAGAIKQRSPSGGKKTWLIGVSAAFNAAGTLFIYDRLLHIGALNGTTTTAQTIGGTLTRNTGGIGNIAFIEIETQIGATGTTATMQYTDDAGNGSQVSPAFAIGGTGLREAQRAIMIPLLSGDVGLRAVTDVDLVATTGTAGSFGLVVAKPIATVPVPSIAGGAMLSTLVYAPGVIEIESGACIAMRFYNTSTTVPSGWVCLSMVEK